VAVGPAGEPGRRKSRKARIRLELTECQKEQIRQATGREVNALELGLEGLPEPAEPPAPEEEKTDG
jgi:hypothetical protein